MSIGLLWASLSPLELGYVQAVALPMMVIGIGQAMVVSPVTAAGIYQAPDDLAGSASGLTNAMHQIGGPIGLSVIMAMTSNFYVSLGWMAGFSLVALLFVLIFIYQFGKNP